MIKKVGLIMLAIGMVMGCIGCGAAEPEQAQEPEVSVIDQRRDAAEAYMRQMATFTWRAQEDIYYTRDKAVKTEADLDSYTGLVLKIYAGKLYRGIPYSYAGASAWSFYDYTSEPDEQGIATLSGLHWRALNAGGSAGAYAGNDCSGAIQLAWDYVGSNIMAASTSNMTKMYGYLPVGDYVSNDNRHTDTGATCNQNGIAVMQQAYAGLQKADAVVKRDSSWGHTMMIVENHVVLDENEMVDGQNSYVTVLHQTTSYMKKEVKQFDPQYGEDVFQIFGIDDKYTYDELFRQGYLPITCDVFIDPAPVGEVFVNDTLSEHTYDTILTGNFVSNRMLSSVTITITDAAGTAVMEGTCYALRQTGQANFTLDLSRFRTDLPELRRGTVAPEELAPGTYHCTHTVRDAHGETYVVRDFDFTVPQK